MSCDLTGKDLIAWRTARFFKDGNVVNLGIGMPTKCLDYLPEGVDIWIDTENGAVGLNGAPQPGEDFDPNVVDAGGRPSKLRVGSACFDSFRSFGFIRGGHVDITVLGAYEVDARACLANWMIPGKTVAGMGGAMDLVTGSKTTIVMSTHCDTPTPTRTATPSWCTRPSCPGPAGAAWTISSASLPSSTSSRTSSASPIRTWRRSPRTPPSPRSSRRPARSSSSPAT